MPAKPHFWSTRRLAMMSGTRKPKARYPLSANALSLTTTAFAAKKPGAVMSTVPWWWVGGVFHRQRAGEAVAELGGIGPQVPARRTGITGDAHVVVAVGATVGDEVEERLRPAHREARKLQERAIPERAEPVPAPLAAGVVFSAPKRM